MVEPVNPNETPSQTFQLWVRDLFATKAGLALVATAAGGIGTAWYASKPPDPTLPFLERSAKAQEETLALHKASIEANKKAMEAAQKAGPQADPILDELRGIHGELAKISAQGDVPPAVQPKETPKTTVPFKFKD